MSNEPSIFESVEEAAFLISQAVKEGTLETRSLVVGNVYCKREEGDIIYIESAHPFGNYLAVPFSYAHPAILDLKCGDTLEYIADFDKRLANSERGPVAEVRDAKGNILFRSPGYNPV